MDGSTHPINTDDGPFPHLATDTASGSVDEREGGYVPPDIVTSSDVPVVFQGPEMESTANTANSIDDVAVTLDLYAALTNNPNISSANTNNAATVTAADISSV